jgi:hypothetical protein
VVPRDSLRAVAVVEYDIVQLILDKLECPADSEVIQVYARGEILPVLVMPTTTDRGKYRLFVLNVASVSMRNWLTNRCQRRLCSLEQKNRDSTILFCSPLLVLWYLHLTRTRKSSCSKQVSSILISSSFDILPAIEYSYSTLLMRALGRLVLVSGLTAQHLALLLGVL